jgi:hypothetical protein
LAQFNNSRFEHNEKENVPNLGIGFFDCGCGGEGAAENYQVRRKRVCGDDRD